MLQFDDEAKLELHDLGQALLHVVRDDGMVWKGFQGMLTKYGT